MTPEMEELNNRRVERRLRRQQNRIRKRRKKLIVSVVAIILMIAGIVGLYFVLRAERNPLKKQEETTAPTYTAEEGDIVIRYTPSKSVTPHNLRLFIDNSNLPPRNRELMIRAKTE